MNDDPLVSIVIPVYNGSNFLKEAIDSALAQNYSNFEIIVVNDGSNDQGETEKIALSYGDKIRYFKKQNGGVATALNLAIREMRGEYFSWLSHDDLYYPNKLSVQIEALKKCGDMSRIVISDYDVLNQESQELQSFKLNEMYSVNQIENSVFPLLQMIVHGCSLLIHKSHFSRVGTFNKELITTQDYDLWFRMFRNQILLYVPQRLIISRIHKNQGTYTIECVPREREELHLRFANSISDKEMIEMYGSKANFYSKMLSTFKSNNMVNAFNEINQKFQQTKMSRDAFEKIDELRELLWSFSNGKAKKICIFGTGRWGINLCHQLQNSLIDVDYFCDNASRKIGYMFENRKCISFEELKSLKDAVLVIIAIKSATDVVKKQLDDNGFKYVVTKQELDKKMFEVPTIKWMSALEGIDGIDYSSDDIQNLMIKFKDTVFDICRYYENKAKKTNS